MEACFDQARPGMSWGDLGHIAATTMVTKGAERPGFILVTSGSGNYHVMSGKPTGRCLQSGDLLGSGTLSGPTATEAGALIELTSGGKNPVQLPDGEPRAFLEDGDAVVMRGRCEKPGAASIGFGEMVGTGRPRGA